MSEDSLDVRIARQVAAREAVDPIALEPPLYEVIDLEALEALVTRRSGDLQDATNADDAEDADDGADGEDTEDAPTFAGQLSFEYCGYLVTVDDTGAVDVSPASGDGDVDAGADGDARADVGGPVTRSGDWSVGRSGARAERTR
ncbi:HalOD1 output domain-containing protein [Halopiger goleimassiliensis]|uniref:HalOD1 output domain-containing protein n=1 Tax=Halopiger goleimassiliensis TaxID=1293048 RepID=UPI0006779054|nr:HalOD1 output domain-containing protein [Halopiger goleimassiliensis]